MFLPKITWSQPWETILSHIFFTFSPQNTQIQINLRCSSVPKGFSLFSLAIFTQGMCSSLPFLDNCLGKLFLGAINLIACCGFFFMNIYVYIGLGDVVMCLISWMGLILFLMMIGHHPKSKIKGKIGDILLILWVCAQCCEILCVFILGLWEI